MISPGFGHFANPGLNWIGLYAELLLFTTLLLVHWRFILFHWKKSCVYGLGALLIGLACWTSLFIGRTNIDQLLSTVAFGAQGVFSVSQELIISLVNCLLFYPLLITLIIVLFKKWNLEKTWINSRLLFYFRNYLHLHDVPRLVRGIQKSFNIDGSRGQAAGRRRMKRDQTITYFQNIIPGLFLIIGIVWLGYEYDISQFTQQFLAIKQKHNEDLFAKHYKDPAHFIFKTPSKPKNLILIYVESLETSYQNKKLFGRDLLASLTHLKHQITFKEFQQTSGANWTIGGIVASQCGIPLKLISIFNGNEMGKQLTQYLPGAVCLGDILKQSGYRNVFMNGPSLKFAGVGTFLKTHQYDERYGKEEWLEMKFKPHDMSGWGLPDDLLFQQAKIKLKQLIHSQQPFNLTLLTIDTHGLNGQLNKYCSKHKGQTFKDIVECTANEVADFIHFVEQQGWLDRITIVVTGDHLAMQNAVSRQLALNPSRYVFNMIISNPPLAKNRESIIHVDLFPTILQALGITWSDDQLALGYSAISSSNQSISGSEHINIMEQIVANRSSGYDNLWKTDHA